ncbi:GrpB family protein [Mahella australiensis]|uniref:GrpB family protein n=1 Tax=Mahella australiensis TaxID=252966 RepID=UPI002479B356|nr:GrpB family protein [Mahella australiensis]
MRVVPYDPSWKAEYEVETQKIRNILKDIIVEIYHIGSTAVEGLAAKTIIDIMPVVTDINSVECLVRFRPYSSTSIVTLDLNSTVNLSS